MFTKINSCTTYGLESFLVEIELDSIGGLPAYIMVGLPDTAVKESKERIYSAIRNSGYQNPIRKLTINLAPADIAKKGTFFDLPIAIGILVSSGQITADMLQNTAIIGELALDGRVRKVNGILPMCLKLLENNITQIIVPEENASEAALVQGMSVFPVSSLLKAIKHLNSEVVITPYEIDLSTIFQQSNINTPNFKDIKGQALAKRALEIAAAGGHNLLMMGSPGAGKSLLSQSLPGILPPLEMEEALEITKLYSISGLLPNNVPLITSRAFRSPHHTISHIGLIGGGTIPKPGEVSLAHLGILFLDEIPEFQRKSLEVLRQPLEDGQVTITRSQTSLTFPSSFTLLAAMNPCPCGNHLSLTRECTCTPFQVQRYWSRLSGPLLDRIDLHIEIQSLNEDELMQLPTGETSAQIRNRVIQARQIQKQRYAEEQIYTNSQMANSHLKQHCILDENSTKLMRQANKKYQFSARSYDRILKVSRTIADLENTQDILPHHLTEALQYRHLDQKKQF